MVGEPSGRSGTGRRTLGEVRDGSRDPVKILGRVVGPLVKFGTGRGTLGEIWEGSGDTPGGRGRVGDHP